MAKAWVRQTLTEAEKDATIFGDHQPPLPLLPVSPCSDTRSHSHGSRSGSRGVRVSERYRQPQAHDDRC